MLSSYPYSFFTCWAKQPYTREMYYTPFTPALWGYLFATILTLSAFYTTIPYLKDVSIYDNIPINMISTFSSMLEKNIEIRPKYEAEISIRLIIGVWVLQPLSSRKLIITS